MEKIFIDCGAHKGESSRKWHKLHPEYKIIAFEPNKHITLNLPKKSKLIRKAVWVYNGNLRLYYMNDITSEGSSLLSNKVNVTDKYEYVECIDFSNWLKRYKDYKIIIKMDIEGAEYDVLEKMLRDDILKYVSKLYVEWHWKKIDMTKNEHLEIFNEIKKKTKLKKEFSRL